MKYSSIRFVVILGALTAVSCDKPKKLEAERAEIDAKIAIVKQESEEYASKLKAFTAPGTMHPVQTERAAQEIVKKVADRESAAASKMAKWLEIEAELETLQSRVDTWKAKHLK